MIFISYRKDDSTDFALALADKLIGRFGDDGVFLDRHQIEPGDHWREAIDEAMSRAVVVLALIGPRWLTTYDEYGQRRIDRDDDVLAYELSVALQKSGLVVIPLYLHGFKPLPAKALPARLVGLAGRQGLAFDIVRDLSTLLAKLEEIPQLQNRDRSGKSKQDGTLSIPIPSYRDLVQPLGFEAESSRHLEHFTGREWVEEKLDDWIKNNPHSKVFCLLGDPGIGKSAIACHWSHTRKDVVAFHHCVHGHAEKTNPKRILLSLAAQMAAHLPEYRNRLEALNTKELREIVNGDTRAVFDNLWLRLLSGSFPVPERTQLIVVDGLDEASRGQDNEVASFIGEVWAGLPPWLRLVVTTRPEQDVIGHLESLHPFFLDAKRYENLQDIRSFLRRALDAQEVSDQMINQIVERSEGMFLYAYLVLDEIRAQRLSVKAIAEFPEGLTGYYKSWFSRRFPDHKVYESKYHQLVDVIIAQRAPLPLSVLASALGLTQHEVNERMTILGVLFPRREECQGGGKVLFVTLMHKSLRDWLTELSLRTREPMAGPFAADPELGNRLLAEDGWKVFHTGRLGQSVYFSQTLLSHLADAGQPERLASVLLDPALLDTVWTNERRCEWLKYMTSLRTSLPLSDLLRTWLKARCTEVSGTARDAALVGKLSRLLQDLGAFDDAVSLAQASLRIWEVNAVCDSPEMVQSLLTLGTIHCLRDEHDQGLPYYERALAISERAYGPNSRETADVIYQLCVLQTEKRNYDKAWECLERYRQILAKLDPPDHAGMATCINDRAVLLTLQGKPGDYLGIYREALAVFEKHLPAGHPEMATTLVNIGRHLMEKNELDAALATFRRGLVMAENLLLPNHPKCRDARGSVATALFRMGKYGDALDLMRHHVLQAETFPGPEHDDTAEARVTLCDWLAAALRYDDEAPREQLRSEVRSQCLRLRSARPSSVLGLLSLGDEFHRIGEAGLRDCVHAAAKHAARGYTHHAHDETALSAAAVCFADLLDLLASARPVAEVAGDVLKRWEAGMPAMKEHSNCFAKTRREVVQLVRWAGQTRFFCHHDPEPAKQAAELILHIGADTPETLDQLAILSVGLIHERFYAACEGLCAVVLERGGAVLGPEHIQTLTYEDNLGFVRERLGNMEEAEGLFRRALEGRCRVLGVDQNDTLSSLSSLVSCMLHAGKFLEALSLVREFADKHLVSGGTGSARESLAVLLCARAVQLKNEFRAYQAARHLYEMSLELNANDAQCHSNLALLLWSCLHDTAVAAEHFEKAISLDMANGNLHSNYALFLAHGLRDMEHAHEHFDKARELCPNDNAIPGNYATWAIIQGDLDVAWQLARRAFKLCCPAPDRIMVRPLFCATVVLLLEGRDPTIPLGQLRRLFDMGIDHVAWVVSALLERTDKDLSSEWSALLRAISAAIADKDEVGALKALSRWQTLEPVGFDVPWPDRS